MLERIIVAVGLGIVGFVAYRSLLALQHRRVSQQAQLEMLAERPALLIFTSPTCAPCKLQQLPIVERLMIDWRDRIDVRLIDVTEQPDLAGPYGVWSLPTTIVLKADRSVVAVNQGVAQTQTLRQQFQQASETLTTSQAASK